MMHERDAATIDVLRKALAPLVGAAADQASQVRRLERSGLTIEPQLLNLLRAQSVAWAHLADSGARAIAASYPANGVVCAIPVGLSPHRVPVLGVVPATKQQDEASR